MECVTAGQIPPKLKMEIGVEILREEPIQWLKFNIA